MKRSNGPLTFHTFTAKSSTRRSSTKLRAHTLSYDWQLFRRLRELPTIQWLLEWSRKYQRKYVADITATGPEYTMTQAVERPCLCCRHPDATWSSQTWPDRQYIRNIGYRTTYPRHQFRARHQWVLIEKLNPDQENPESAEVVKKLDLKRRRLEAAGATDIEGSTLQKNKANLD